MFFIVTVLNLFYVPLPRSPLTSHGSVPDKCRDKRMRNEIIVHENERY